MSRLVLYIASSLDGFIARTDGDVDWLDPFMGQGTDYGYGEFMASVGATIMGRRTYEHTKGYGGGKAGAPSFVLSTRAADPAAPAGTVFSKAPVADVLSQARAASSPDKDIWLIGGGDVMGQFRAEGLIDLYRIYVIPVLLGDGLPLWTGPRPSANLKLVSTESYSTGIVELRYEPQR